MSKPNFRPIAPLDADDAALERVNEQLGVPVMLRTGGKASQPAAATASRLSVAPPRRQQKLTVRIPGYLVDELKRKALDQRTTVRQIVLLALQKDGFAIEAADLLPGAGGSD